MKKKKKKKKKKGFFAFACYVIYGVEAVGLPISNYIYYDFCENVNFGAISWKISILSIAS